MRMHVIMLKTLKDLFSFRRTMLFVIAMIIAPLIGAGAFSEGAQISKMPLMMQDQMAVGFYIVLSFMWMVGIPLVLLAGLTCGGFIAKEDEEGTLLLLVSKPIRRCEIVAGKFLAFMINAALLSLTALLLSALIISSVLELDVYIFNSILSLVQPLFLYSLFVAAVFGGVATALSSVFKSVTKTAMTIAGITILVFFGMMIVRSWLGMLYEDYSISHIDVNYHLGNVFLLFLDSSGYRMAPIFQGIMGMFTGTFDAADMAVLYDMDIGALPPQLPAKDYCTPPQSMLIWSAIATALFILGLMKFERREVN
jgi:ABC-2 type transport system permease protein